MKTTNNKSAKQVTVSIEKVRKALAPKKKTGVKEVTVKELIALLKKGKKVTTPGGTAHRLSYCMNVADKNAMRPVKIAA